MGSTLTGPDGPLADGTYETADGYAIVVADGKVASMEPMTPNEGEEMAKIKQENETLKKQLAEATQTVAQSTEVIKAAAKQAVEFKNAADEVKTLKNELEKLKNMTFGDDKVPVDATNKTDIQNNVKDPMVEAMAQTMGAAYTSSRRF